MKTYNIKLEFKSKEDKERLIQTFLVHQKVWNYISEYVFKTKIELSSKKVHEKTYHKCRKLFPDAPEMEYTPGTSTCPFPNKGAGKNAGTALFSIL